MLCQSCAKVYDSYMAGDIQLIQYLQYKQNIIAHRGSNRAHGTRFAHRYT